MIRCVDYSYCRGGTQTRIASFFFDGRRIWFEISPQAAGLGCPHLKPGDLQEHLKHIISLPLMRSELRAKTMPSLFDRLEPNSLEHFRAIRHDTSCFKFSSTYYPSADCPACDGARPCTDLA